MTFHVIFIAFREIIAVKLWVLLYYVFRIYLFFAFYFKLRNLKVNGTDGSPNCLCILSRHIASITVRVYVKSISNSTYHRIVLNYIISHCSASHGIVSYRIASYCIILYCIVLYCIVLYCIVFSCIALQRIARYRIISYRIVLYRIILYRIVLYRIILHRI